MALTQHPYLNLGCGPVVLPAARPTARGLVPSVLFDYPLWINVDHVRCDGVDRVFDLFSYPWPLESDSADGALLSHIVEHIPHGHANDEGFYLFFQQLARVLTDGSIAHVVVPYGLSHGALQDPTHTRLIVAETFQYLTDWGAQLRRDATTRWTIEHFSFNLTEEGEALRATPRELDRALLTRFNIASELYARLRLTKAGPGAAVDPPNGVVTTSGLPI